MSTRLLIALVILVIVPLLLLGWISSATLRSEQERSKQALEGLFQQRLLSFADACQLELDAIQAELLMGVGDTSFTPSKLRDLRRQSPLVDAVFWLNASNQLLYPEIPDQVDTGRLETYLAIDELIGFRPQRTVSDRAVATQTATAKGNSGVVAPQSEPPMWMPWYRQQGLQLVLWLPGRNGDVVGVLLNRPAWMSRVVSRLPDSATFDDRLLEFNKSPAANAATESVSALSLTRVQLLNAQGGTVYQWGSGINRTDSQSRWYALAELPLQAPLAAWKLRYESGTPLGPLPTASLPTLLGLLAVGLLLILLGVYVASSLHRQMRLAAQQVSFAGQVSHELRTPLTNIRLYAEMAQQELETCLERPSPAMAERAAPPHSDAEYDSQMTADVALVASARRRLTVIEQETERLGRLCGNVLELVRRPQAGKKLSEQVDVAATMQMLVDQFRPALESADCAIEVDCQLPGPVVIDRCALEMTLMNLLSNVEKYALAGKFVRVSSWLVTANSPPESQGNESQGTYAATAGQLGLRVEDRGPGIPRSRREKIFRPFYRIDSSINAPAGTGIGLSIARQAAQRAGGTLRVVPTEVGACFELRLPVG